jgi:hypothetical protein
MTYPASPPRNGDRVRLDLGRFWAGAVATAVVAALIALVGILICRWTLGIPILSPAGAGAWGDAHTGEYVVASVIIALVAAALLNLLVLGAPRPGLFFGWIMGLATLVAVVYPFSTSAPIAQKIATAVVDLALGVAIASLLNAVAARAIRPPGPPGPPPPTGPDAGWVPGQREDMPTRPNYVPRDGGPRQWE